MKKIVPVLLALLFATSIKANDAVFYSSGATLVPIKETDISISKEILTITVGTDDYATVDVYYEFYNPTKTKTVTMAFEALAPNYSTINRDGTHPCIKDFTVQMNGSSLPFENALVEYKYGKPTDYTPLTIGEGAYEEDDEEGIPDGDYVYDEKQDKYVHFSYCYFFTADFKKGVNTVHHTYRYRMNQNMYANYVIDYWLTPAARWAGGKIGDFTLRIKSERYGEEICMVDSLFMGKPWDINSYQYFFYHDNPYALYEGKVEHFMLADLNPNKALEWHSTDFVPSRNITIYPADYIMPDFRYATGGTIVVDDEAGVECVYVAEDETRYFIVASDYGWIDKSKGHIEKRSAQDGQGCITSKVSKPVYVRLSPGMNTDVIQVIGVAQDIPDSYECLGYKTVSGSGKYGLYHSWFIANVEGIIGYVDADEVMWEPYNIKVPERPHKFYNYDDPSSVIIPEGVTMIDNGTFKNYKDIKSVTIAQSVKVIGVGAFEDCSGLESVTMPDSITAIYPWTFRGCSSLKAVTIPAGVTRIQGDAFKGCTSLTSVTMNSTTPPTIWEVSFDPSIYRNATLYVPKGSKSAYMSDYDWKRFRNIVEK